MAYTTIDNPELYFQAKTYTGDGGTTQALTLDGSENMQPDLVWVKMRSESQSHILVDSVRGANKYLGSNHTGVEGTDINSVTAFGSDGFTVGNDNAVNKSSGTYVAWNWKKDATAGFDIVTYTGNGSNRTVSHSLSAKPDWMLHKTRDTTAQMWSVYHSSRGATKHLGLDRTNAEDTGSNYYQDTEPTSSVFSVGSESSTNHNGAAMLTYLWSEVKGFSKFGSYTGNATGGNEGPFIYTGFKPAWIMIKNASAGSTDWLIYDNKRGGPVATYYGNNNKFFLKANTGVAEANETFDMYSNGFKIKITNNFLNGDGNTLIYMAFAESPFVSSNKIPTTAR